MLDLSQEVGDGCECEVAYVVGQLWGHVGRFEMPVAVAAGVPGAGVEMQRRFHLTRGELFAYRAGSGRRENRVSRWAPPRAPGIARNVRAAAALAGWLWRAVRRAGRAGGGAHGAWRGPSSLTTDLAVVGHEVLATGYGLR